MICKIEGCDGRHCKECGRHIPEEMSEQCCDICIVDRETRAAEETYGCSTDEEYQAVMELWDI
jgi:hypothetical protein